MPAKSQYRILPSKRYRRDIKHIARSGRYDLRKLEKVITLLASGKKLPANYHNHTLKGKWKDFEECHIEPDWLLVYQRNEDTVILHLIRTGKHTDIFGG